ncbi:hypothetical protein S40285_01020 [Stachybotrys chlorohalonatus IBT 40285]|uniref:HMG box domain-containing protein n=1 Tax=Stachybotrys chlorohalonatus (strain IBT 40285) TaxID=1283841 RepID=A0A084QKE8_STAC4|nr:hypothetical protein S40285_01020 [Stachybotrys chlorohalonata IBT 40285]
MLNTIGWASARRLALVGKPALAQSSMASQRLAIRPAPIARSFAFSTSAPSPAKASTDAASVKTKKADPAAKKQAAKAAADKKKAKEKAAKEKERAARAKEKEKAAKARAKAKAAAAKPKPAKKAKELTPEQLSKFEIKELKKLSLLDEPDILPATPWHLYLSQGSKARFEENPNLKLTEYVGVLSTEYQNLTESQLEDLKTQAAANREANAQAHQAWVESHSPAVIYVANVARRRLRNRPDVSKTYKGLRSLEHSRLPGRARASFPLYMRANYHNMDGETNADKFRAVAEAWRNLPDAEKQPFIDLSHAELEKTRTETLALKQEAHDYWKEKTTLGCPISPRS